MLKFWIIAAYIFYCLLNGFIACVNTDIVNHRKRVGNPKQIEHPLWAAIYCACIAPMWFAMHSWWFIGSLALLHLHVFGMFYAAINGYNPFYLSKTSKAITEKTLLKLGFKSAEIPYIISFIISLALLIKTIRS